MCLKNAMLNKPETLNYNDNPQVQVKDNIEKQILI